jgi:4-alpha-glucanotransferase
MDIVSQGSQNAASATERACERFGVETRFWDIWGKQHHASEPVLQAILKSLGAQEDDGGALPASVVVSQGSAMLPSHFSGLPDVEIEFEDGSRRKVTAESLQLPDLPLGYHRLIVKTHVCNLIVCPDRVFQPGWLEEGKAGGIVVSLYGLRSSRNWGCGDTTDLRALADWAAASLGASFIGLNPLHAIPNRQPYNTSPYLPNSSFYRNHIYLDLEACEDFQASQCAGKLLQSPKVQQELAALRDSQYVEYERISRLKLQFLKVLFRSFLALEHRRNSARAQAFRAFLEKEGKLLDLFAVHSALDEKLHLSHPDAWNWPAWPKDYQDPGSAATAKFAQEHWRTVLFHKYIQWQLDLQFAAAHEHALARGMRIGLYHDLALATDGFGSDLWAHRDFYAAGCRVGSPPDNFSPQGQDWSFPPPNSRRHFEDGYKLFAESIRKASAHGGALRIDHVMRFFRLYWIPDGENASNGTYVRDRYEDLVRVLALESVRGQFVVVGEDLGTVPDHVRDTLKEFGVLSYRLCYFERDASGRFYRPDEYPRQALVSPSTHDLPTLAGFWQGTDIDARRAARVITDEDSYRSALSARQADKQSMLDLLHELDLLPSWFSRDARVIPELAAELHNAIIGFLALTPSQLFAINQEDLFKDTDQQNLPGTTAEHPNWRHKMKYSIEQLNDGSVRGYAGMLRSWLEKTGRIT